MRVPDLECGTGATSGVVTAFVLPAARSSRVSARLPPDCATRIAVRVARSNCQRAKQRSAIYLSDKLK